MNLSMRWLNIPAVCSACSTAARQVRWLVGRLVFALKVNVAWNPVEDYLDSMQHGG